MSIHAVPILISSLIVVFMVDADVIVTIAIMTNLLRGKERLYIPVKDNI